MVMLCLVPKPMGNNALDAAVVSNVLGDILAGHSLDDLLTACVR